MGISLNTLLRFPNVRKENNTTGQPLFSGDILNANESILTAMKYLLGSSDSDFYIIYGLEMTMVPAPVFFNYSSGLVYMNAQFYYFDGVLQGGKYLVPSPTDTQSKVFQDSTARNTYTIYDAVSSNTYSPTGSPVFTSTMDTYRLNLKILNALIAGLDSDVTTLQGDIANVYTKTEIDTQNASLLTKIVNIGDWDMDNISTVDVTHGLADNTKIRSVEVMIRNDAGTILYPLNCIDHDDPTLVNGGVKFITSTIVRLIRNDPGIFANLNFDSLSYNRGYVTIKYLP